MFELTHYYLFVFGVLTIAGGVIGFVKAGSRASLVAGGIAGVLLLVAGALLPGRPQAGLLLGLGLSLALAGRFVPIFLRTKGFMPSGLMSFLSVLGLVLTAATLFTLGS